MNQNDKDVTNLVEFDLNDDECLPIRKCVCGHKFDPWKFFISIYRETAYQCHWCTRKLYFEIALHIYEIQRPDQRPCV